MGLERANGEEKLKGGGWEKRSGGKRDERLEPRIWRLQKGMGGTECLGREIGLG